MNSPADNLQFHRNQKWDLPPPRPSLNPEWWEGKEATCPPRSSPTLPCGCWRILQRAGRSLAYWHILGMPAPRGRGMGESWILCKLGLHNKIDANLGYIARSCYKASEIDKLISIVRKTGSSRTACKQITTKKNLKRQWSLRLAEGIDIVWVWSKKGGLVLDSVRGFDGSLKLSSNRMEVY